MKTVLEFKAFKKRGEKISMITCYDYAFANIISESTIDCVLVGDTVSMVVHGFATTASATMDMMVLHVQAVARGLGDKLLIADLPFLSYRESLPTTMKAVHALMQAGARAIKLEGAKGNLKTIAHIVDSGVPVIGHLGLTPQAVHALGGYKVQGRSQSAADTMLQDARDLVAAGCCALVLECVPYRLARHITQAIDIPTIGIGAGPDTDGQVLVLYDLLGLQKSFQPKFLRRYMEGQTLIQSALDQYTHDVKAVSYPTVEEHSYSD